MFNEGVVTNATIWLQQHCPEKTRDSISRESHCNTIRHWSVDNFWETSEIVCDQAWDHQIQDCWKHAIILAQVVMIRREVTTPDLHILRYEVDVSQVATACECLIFHSAGSVPLTV
eukprot:CAMPEP_0115358714 /NCGR_PEP_ID=MMETSP0270-20121206/100802_1 /TAXON_ID=71861 /ORGANISM="Scrippsiella trochoidea, Strain CCMP3099" /LENGTH=115 /DNA_ID=CAMNT_0002781203 /DNA_START=217 /DNA_END=564 /DNA_ORIENTATION=+